MNIELIEKEGLKREIKIEIPSEIVDATYNEVYDELKKNVKIKGFRPGKIPTKVIRTKFKSEATGEVIEKLVGKYYQDAIKEKELEPAGAPILTAVEIDEGQPLKATLGIEVMPKIESVNSDDLKTKPAEAEVTDPQVDRVIEDIRMQGSSLRVVERAAGEKDVLICDLKAVDGATESFKDQSLAGQEIDLGNEMTKKEFREELLGKKRDDKCQLTMTYEDNFPEKSLAGKSVTFDVEVKEVKERILAELNDDFAKSSGHGETLLELKLNIRKKLQEELETANLQTTKKQLIDQILEKNQIDIPEVMLEGYFKNLIAEHEQKKMEFDEQELRARYRETGQNSIRWFLLFHRFAQLEKIEVSPEDTELWIKKFADNYKIDIAQAKELLAKTGKAAEIRDGILEEKVILLLAEKAETKKG